MTCIIHIFDGATLAAVTALTAVAALAAAVRGERALPVTLDEELVVQETLLRVSDML